MEAELVVDTQVQEATGTIAKPNTASLERLDAAVATYVARAEAFECRTAEDYAEGGNAVVAIRSLDKLYGDFFTPIKRWWDARKQEVLDDEKRRRGPLETAKSTIGSKMLAWKKDEDARLAKIQRERDEAERKRAEELRLAQAEAIAERGRQTGNEALVTEAVAMLDKPLDIVPTSVGTTVPKVAGLKTVQRSELTIERMDHVLIAIGCTLLVQDADTPHDVRQAAMTYANPKCVDGLLDDAKRVEKLVDALKPFLKDVAKVRGSGFNLRGVSVGKKEGLG